MPFSPEGEPSSIADAESRLHFLRLRLEDWQKRGLGHVYDALAGQPAGHGDGLEHGSLRSVMWTDIVERRFLRDWIAQRRRVREAEKKRARRGSAGPPSLASRRGKLKRQGASFHPVPQKPPGQPRGKNHGGHRRP